MSVSALTTCIEKGHQPAKIVIYKAKGIGPTVSVPLKLPKLRGSVNVCGRCGTVYVSTS